MSTATTYPPLPPGAAMRWDVVRRSLPAQPGDVLEIGCGQGAFSVRLTRSARSFLALEPDPTSFQIAQSRLGDKGTALNGSVEALPPERKFDTLCAFEVIEHLENDVDALAAWVSRLRPGGTLLVSAPADPKRMGAWDELVGHCRRYDPEAMATMLRQAGLEDVRVRLYGYPAGPLLEFARNLVARWRMRRGQHEVEVEARTASSGRQLQPNIGLAGSLVTLISIPSVLLQRVFPDRGIALLGVGRVPA